MHGKMLDWIGGEFDPEEEANEELRHLGRSECRALDRLVPTIANIPGSTTIMISIGRDELLDRVRDALPEPVREEDAIDGSTVLVGGDPGEVVVRITSEEITVSVFEVRWEGPHTPRVCPEPLASLAWHRLPASWTMMTLSGLVDAASELRRAGFGRCEHCGRTMPPEWMHGQGVCQSCAEQDLGIVH